MPTVPLWLVVSGGILVFVVLAFQTLLGNRKIPAIKGPAWRKWHKNTAWVLLALAVVHAIAALDYWLV